MMTAHNKVLMALSVLFDKTDLTQFLYLVVFVALLMIIAFFGSANQKIDLYILVIISLSAIVFAVKRLIARLFEIKLSNKVWISGLIFSAVATLIFSALSLPVVVPILNTQGYQRLKTLRGLKKGEVTIKEKWEVSVFSSMALLAFSALFFFAAYKYNLQPMFYGGSFLAIYTFINMLPYDKFDGAFLAYHNAVGQGLFTLLALLFVVLSYVSYQAMLGAFAVFVIFGLLSYRLKLW